jgi:hypothetical protein
MLKRQIKLIFTFALTSVYCFALGQSKLPNLKDVKNVISLTISQKMTSTNPSCEYGQCGEWWTANKDSLYYKSDTLKFYNSSNIAYSDTAFCTSLVWSFEKENTFNNSEAQMCQEPTTRSIKVGQFLSGGKERVEIPNRYKVISKDNTVFIIIYVDQRVFETFKVIELTKTIQKNLGDKSYILTLTRQK